MTSYIDQLLTLDSRSNQNSKIIWNSHCFRWRMPETWIPQLSTWLAPRLRTNYLKRLRPGKFLNYGWDDPAWSEHLEKCLTSCFNNSVEDLAEDFNHAVLVTYHGCRTDDAGSYFRNGLRVHNREVMISKLKAFVQNNKELASFQDMLDAEISRVNNNLDDGKLYVVADDTILLTRTAHYLIYGSEWIVAVLGNLGRSVLIRTGAPTLLEIYLPLKMSPFETRKELARYMLNEWTRFVCNQPDWSAPIDFSFCLETDIPAAQIISHSHPIELPDPLEQQRIYHSTNVTCAYCKSYNPD